MYILGRPCRCSTSEGRLHFYLLIAVLVAPPGTSMPGPANAAPLCASVHSTGLAKVLFESGTIPTPSYNAPSVGAFAYLPLGPSDVDYVSSPAPPSSHDFVPKDFYGTSLGFLMRFYDSHMSATATLGTRHLVHPAPLRAAAASSDSIARNFGVAFYLLHPSTEVSASFSAISGPVTRAIDVCFPTNTFE